MNWMIFGSRTSIAVEYCTVSDVDWMTINRESFCVYRHVLEQPRWVFILQMELNQIAFSTIFRKDQYSRKSSNEGDSFWWELTNEITATFQILTVK